MATTAASPVFIDTNVLVYATIPASPFHLVATAALHRIAMAAAPAWISRQVIREYLVQLTRPGVLPAHAAASIAASQVTALASMYHVADETAHVTAELLQLVQTISVSGKQIHDANIAATMRAYGIDRILTNNPNDFARYASFMTVETL